MMLKIMVRIPTNLKIVKIYTRKYMMALKKYVMTLKM